MSLHTPAQDTPGGSHTHPHLRSRGESGLEEVVPRLLTHPHSSLPGLTLALGAGSVGLEACRADTLETPFCVLTAAIGTGRGAPGTLIHIWAEEASQVEE